MRRHPAHVVAGLLLGAVLAVAVVLLRSEPAAAHAELVATDPPSGGSVDDAPTAIVLRFSERVSASEDAVRLHDASGARIPLGPTVSDGATVRAEPGEPLAESAYVVTWRVTSEDGHPIAGSFVFAVGAASVSDVDPAVGPDDAWWEVLGWFARAVATVGLLVAAGLTTAVLAGMETTRGLFGLRTCAAAAAIVASLLGIPVQAALQTGGGLGALGREGALADALGGGVGWSLLVLVCGLGVLALADPVGGRWHRWASSVGVLAVAAAPALTGHTRSTHPEALLALVDALHVLAAAVWVGALVALVAVVPRGSTTAFPRTSVRLAVGGVASATTAGLVLGWSQVEAFSALWSTRYGGLLLGKTALVAAAVGIGRWNRRRGSRRWLTTEVLLLAGVVGITAVLVQEPPPRSAAPATAPAVIAAFGEGTVEVVAEPSSSGEPVLGFAFASKNDAIDDRWVEVVTRLSRPDLGIEGLRAVASREGPGVWRTSPVRLPVAGTWTIELFAGTADGAVVTALVDLELEVEVG
jgi:copper transport protein